MIKNINGLLLLVVSFFTAIACAEESLVWRMAESATNYHWFVGLFLTFVGSFAIFGMGVGVVWSFEERK